MLQYDAIYPIREKNYGAYISSVLGEIYGELKLISKFIVI